MLLNKATIEINGYLKRNDSILLELMGKNKSQIKVYRNVLEQKRFRLKYHTHFQINSHNKMFHYIYDLAWMEFSDNEVIIIKKIIHTKSQSTKINNSQLELSNFST